MKLYSHISLSFWCYHTTTWPCPTYWQYPMSYHHCLILFGPFFSALYVSSFACFPPVCRAIMGVFYRLLCSPPLSFSTMVWLMLPYHLCHSLSPWVLPHLLVLLIGPMSLCPPQSPCLWFPSHWLVRVLIPSSSLVSPPSTTLGLMFSSRLFASSIISSISNNDHHVQTRSTLGVFKPPTLFISVLVGLSLNLFILRSSSIS